MSHLASGGMGQVYLARATGLGGFERQVVVKTLDQSITDDDDAFVTMFLDEARLVGALHHQYIAPVYEVGLDEEGHYYLVMDYVHGETAEAVFRVSTERVQPLPLAFSLTVLSCVASALDYAHSLCAADGTPLDIVHRDVSLSNVMCGHDGAVKLIDFGIAKASNRATKTQVGTLKGKIGYLAPEQILRQHVDHRADIFALGIVLYELTTATRAFRDTSDLVTLERITNGDIRRPTEVIKDYPPELERIVMRALNVEPERRYAEAGEMGREIERFAAGRGIALGHAAIVDVMTKLFAERRGRRRLARGSNEVGTDPSIVTVAQPIVDERTPVTDIVQTGTVESETLTRNVTIMPRSQRPTTPIVDRSKSRIEAPSAPSAGVRATTGSLTPTPDTGTRPSATALPPAPATPRASSQRSASVPNVAIEDLPTPIADPQAQLIARHALIPLEDRPTPIAELSPLPVALSLPERPTPPQRPSRQTPIPRLTPSRRMSQPSPHTPAPVRQTPRPARGSPSDGYRIPQASPSEGIVVAVRFNTPPPVQPMGEQSTGIVLPETPPRTTNLGTGPAKPPRITGPLLPEELEDAPTTIAGTLADREDPTDVTFEREPMRLTPRERRRTATAEIVRPPRIRWNTAHLAHAVVSRMRKPETSTHTYLMLCALFVLAVLVAILVSMI